jgi:hypothetical protein
VGAADEPCPAAAVRQGGQDSYLWRQDGQSQLEQTGFVAPDARLPDLTESPGNGLHAASPQLPCRGHWSSTHVRCRMVMRARGRILM